MKKKNAGMYYWILKINVSRDNPACCALFLFHRKMTKKSTKNLRKIWHWKLIFLTWSYSMWACRHSRQVGTWQVRHVSTRSMQGMLAREHTRNVATWAHKHPRHIASWARKHARHLDTWVRKHTRHVATWVRKHLRHLDTWARKHARHVAMWACKHARHVETWAH